jgi:hypothetical protein
MKNSYRTLNFSVLRAILVLALSCFAQLALSSPAGLTLQGRLVKDGTAISGPVTLRVSVRSPNSDLCLLFEETHSLTLDPDEGGIFSVQIGAGTRTANDKAFSLMKVFSNTGVIINSLTCPGTGATAYTPLATHSRHVYLSFVTNVGTVTFNDPYVVQSVPYALEAERLAGKTSSEFIQTNADTTQAKIDDIMAATPYAELLALLAGNSAQYATTAGGSFSSNVDLNSHKIVGVANPTAATDAANKQYTDGYVGGKAADTTTLNALAPGDAGKILSWSGTQWTASSADDSTKLPLAGGTMSGPIAMGSSNMTGAGFISQNAGKYLQFGTLDDTAEAALVATPLVASHKGATWYNTTSGQLKYWNGTQVKSSFINGGNSFGATSSFGTADDNDLNFVSYGSTRMTMLAGGSIGVGTTTPIYRFQVAKDINGNSYSFDEGQIVVTGSTGQVHGMAVGYDTTNNRGFIFPRSVGSVSRPLILGPGTVLSAEPMKIIGWVSAQLHLTLCWMLKVMWEILELRRLLELAVHHPSFHEMTLEAW